MGERGTAWGVGVRPQFRYRRPPLYPAQTQAVFRPARIACVEACVKAGKTTAGLVWLVEQALQAPAGAQLRWVAPWYRLAQMAYRRLRGAVRALTPHFTAHESALAITVPTGARITFVSADDPDTLYGEDVVACVLDEASRMREAAWHAVRSTLSATRGPVRILGNVRGRRNWFWTLCRRAEVGDDPELAYTRLTWREPVAAGILDPHEVDAARRLLPPAVFQELYEAVAADEDTSPFRVTVAPLSDAPPVCWGWDLGKHEDWTVGVGLDAEGRVCRLVRWRVTWLETIERILALVGELPCLIDSTGVGDPIVETLQRRGGHVTGYVFTARSKQQLFEALAVDLQAGLTVPEGVLAQELRLCEQQPTTWGIRYGAPPGAHDDAVCALALARQCWRTAALVRPSIRSWDLALVAAED